MAAMEADQIEPPLVLRRHDRRVLAPRPLERPAVVDRPAAESERRRIGIRRRGRRDEVRRGRVGGPLPRRRRRRGLELGERRRSEGGVDGIGGGSEAP